MQIKKWVARRAGPGITVTGISSVDGSAVKVTQVDHIEPRAGGVIVAVQRDGDEYTLVP